MTPGSYKREARRRTAKRVDAKTRAFDPAAGLDRELGDRIKRDDERKHRARCYACGQFVSGEHSGFCRPCLDAQDRKVEQSWL